MRTEIVLTSVNLAGILLLLASFFAFEGFCAAEQRLLVGMTVVRGAAAAGAVCLDGSPPAYHLHRGHGAGAANWLLQFEGGGWCNDIASCMDRAVTRRGSTHYMNKLEVFSGILSDNALLNPVRDVADDFNDWIEPYICEVHDFYNWNRVKLRYCDGASFAGNSEYGIGNSTLYFRGQRIWHAIIRDLLPKGLNHARKALLSGCSAGGLATFLHCDEFTGFLPSTARVKCLSDAGFFLDVQDIVGNHTMRSFYDSLVYLQGIELSLNTNCTKSLYFPTLCFFPQYALPYIQTPYFILNSAYDVYQFHHGWVPSSADPYGHWRHCVLDPAECSPYQITTLQGFRDQMLEALKEFQLKRVEGMFINSCFAHCQSESQDTWLAPDSPRVHNKTIAQAVGDWYFGRNITKEIDCPYPCDSTCKNLIPQDQPSSK